jgi:hypothetical protein
MVGIGVGVVGCGKGAHGCMHTMLIILVEVSQSGNSN